MPQKRCCRSLSGGACAAVVGVVGCFTCHGVGCFANKKWWLVGRRDHLRQEERCDRLLAGLLVVDCLV